MVNNYWFEFKCIVYMSLMGLNVYGFISAGEQVIQNIHF